MAKLNTEPKVTLKTHEGGAAKRIDAEAQLRRSVMSCMLWEQEFYEDGQDIASRIKALAQQVPLKTVASIATDAKDKMHLRHAPLWLALAMLGRNGGNMVGDTIAHLIQRVDELPEIITMYWKDGKEPLAKQLKRGIALAFPKFNEYQLAKYDRDTGVKLRDALFLTHPQPKDEEQAAVWKRVAGRTLAVPETWETALSSGADKKETWEGLLRENKLGDLALLRNLRNMGAAKVERSLISDAFNRASFSQTLPFRFLAAAKQVPEFEDLLEVGLFKSVADKPKLQGKTILIVDVSGSMYGQPISAKSQIDRAQVACSLAVLCRELCTEVSIYATAGNDRTRIHQTELVPARRGFALSDYIHERCKPLGGGGIFLVQVLEYVRSRGDTADRTIVITDEQDCDPNRRADNAQAIGQGYMVNVASAKNGVSYGKWVHIDGWSEAVVDYIQAMENRQ